MKLKSLLLATLSLATAGCTIFGLTACERDAGTDNALVYTLKEDGTYSVSAKSFKKMKGDIVIPSSYEGRAVTEIGQNAFSERLPDAIIIEPPAFFECKITSIEIPDSVTKIGSDAFLHCSSLTAVYITDISAWCNISFENAYANPFAYAENLYLNGNHITDLNIPSDVTSIEDYAFLECSSLMSVVIPDSVTKIGNFAFYHCSSLPNVVIPESVTSIGDSAFAGCRSLKNIDIPDSITKIEDAVFSGCESLTSIKIPGSVTEIGGYAFWNCNSLTSIKIPDGVTEIGYHTFEGCTSLTSLVIPDSVTSIKSHAFNDCDGLTSIEIPDSVTTIGYSAFGSCDSLTSVTIGNGVTEMEEAFPLCDGLTEIHYNGTQEQWENIEKELRWNITLIKKVICTDGTIELEL